MRPLVNGWDHLFTDLLAPLGIPKHTLLAARFGLNAIRSGRGLAEAHFRTPAARALFSGITAHSVLPLEARPGAAIGLMLGIAGHAVGWPIVRGGAQNLANALASYLRSLGGEIRCGEWVKSVDDLPAKRVFLDITPRQVLKIAGHKLPACYRRGLTRYRYGPAVFKLDWALSDPIPWQAAACRRAGTVHVGGTLDEISLSERAAWTGRECERPFVLLVQPSLFDPTRAPAGKHTAWAYCHVPHGSTVDMTERIEAQIERFAPGFRETILARHVMSPTDMEQHNPNYVGGDIGGGAADFRQLFARPVLKWNPYSTPIPGVYLCSSSTPPGGGVHGLCGYHSVNSARL
jgi:phytoene dehydrogenase-like protein